MSGGHAVLKREGHTPRKRFGQNFLVDEGVIRDIVAAIAPQPGDRMVEIGPGLGALTRPLLERLDRLHVVEIDRDLVARLRKAHDPQRLVIHEGDALRFDLATLGPGLRIVGNLPYNISSPLLFRFAEAAQALRDVHVMLQREVVERMVAAPGGGEYGRLSVMLQYRFIMEWVLHVPPDAFRPQPKVESAVVRMVPRPAAECTARDEALLSRVVAAAFSQRRKMLRNTLRGLLGEAELAALGISPTARAEELAVADYVRIADHLAGRP